MHQASILMTFFVALMGATWYGLETGMIGEETADAALASASEAAGEMVSDAVLAAAESQVSLHAKADASVLED